MALLTAWTPLAISHLQNAFDFVAQENEPAAHKLIERVIAGVERLERYPNMGRPGRVEGTRELVVAGTPFVVPYRIRGGKVQILAVFHAARKWPETW